MQVFQTCGVPPSLGKIIFPMIGCTKNSRKALTKRVKAKNSRAKGLPPGGLASRGPRSSNRGAGFEITALSGQARPYSVGSSNRRRKVELFLTPRCARAHAEVDTNAGRGWFAGNEWDRLPFGVDPE